MNDRRPATIRHSDRRGSRSRRRLRRAAAATAATIAVVLLGAGPALACGGLVGENGSIELVRTTTLAAYHDGVERYVTSFEFTGEGEEVGSIIPLPDVPSEVERGGDWTLQRLQQEVAPPTDGDEARAESASADQAEVILEVEIDALDITVLKGGAEEVGTWAVDNGFLLTPDSPEVLRFYAERSPVFMAARFNAGRAAELGQQAGDGTPIMVTIPTDDPWVPLRILGLGLEEDQQVEADVFLLTDDRPQLLAGGKGLELARSEEAGASLLADLRSDEGMEWVPDDMWFTHLPLEADAGELDYDLAVSTDADAAPAVADAGVPEVQAVPIDGEGDAGIAWWPVTAGVLAAVTVIGGVSLVRLMAAPPMPAVRTTDRDATDRPASGPQP
ncbi:DUF2330 domain-containing protein [Iamia sp.]|uniref:DUF2330 domain-containing protein n=1 Tax=Iamia sp. TaxID=2722710 RepID=UPI002CEFC113|nr:DUF2330 domain-containing protein [Iamia sp.]HXH58625.1 DUF2330 domain-containing protein [Iamia sp.]